MKLLLYISILVLSMATHAQKPVVVDVNGKGDFTSIQSAINSLNEDSEKERIIQIKNGVYNEKLLIEKNNIVFEGESRDKVIITQSIARDEFRCSHKDDWGVATVNINGNDITLKNLTIKNSFGFEFKEEFTIPCDSDSSHMKIIKKSGHQMALRSLKATRLKAINCYFSSFGGDTVSPWNVENGFFYFKDCQMEGGVDFYCPRGWAWAENCDFYSFGGTASVWHDGSKNPDSKSVLMNCRFSGIKNFYLGRYHRDAQMYLVNCSFDENMRDSAIYHVPKSSEVSWGNRIYYFNCHRKGGDYDWTKNNLPESLTENQITLDWLFNAKWHPEKK